MLKLGALVIDEEEVRKRKAYLEIMPEDEGRLRKAHPTLQRHAAEIIDGFYAYLLGHEHTRRILSAPGLVERLKRIQAKYFEELTSGTYDVAYFEGRVRIGEAHQRISLAPEWYLGAYVRYLHIASDVLSRSMGRDYEQFYQTMVSLTKIIYLDMGLAIDAYYFSSVEALAQSNQELKRAQEVRRQLTDMIVHDLQNPLAGVEALLMTLKSGTSLSSSERGAVDEALERCNDLSHMIMNVLQVSRAEKGEMPTYLENLDIARVARVVVDAVRPVAEREGRRVLLEAPTELLWRSDENLLQRLFQNLVRNGLRHTPRGTTITVKVEATAGGARVRVIDDGPGIAPEVHPLLFEAFGGRALREKGVRVDTGLGLAFCKAATRALRGTIRIESDGRRGTEFIVELPVLD